MQTFRPIRVERTYTQRIEASPVEVFPLLCPVREVEWVEGWAPLAVYTNSGIAEPDCIFVTGENEPEAYWMMTERDPATWRTTIVKVTPGMTIGKITIVLRENGAGWTDAQVTYMYTAMSEEGAEFVRSYSQEYYEEFMRFWETALNEYLCACRRTPDEILAQSGESGEPSQ